VLGRPVKIIAVGWLSASKRSMADSELPAASAFIRWAASSGGFALASSSTNSCRCAADMPFISCEARVSSAAVRMVGWVAEPNGSRQTAPSDPRRLFADRRVLRPELTLR
jgi:hypothetical protein